MEREQLDRIEQKVDDVKKVVNEHLVLCEKRIVPLETKVKLILWVGGVVLTMGLGAILKACTLV